MDDEDCESEVVVHVVLSDCVVAEQGEHCRSDVTVHMPVKYEPARQDVLQGVHVGLLRRLHVPTKKLPTVHDAACVQGVHCVLVVAVQLAEMYDPAAQVVAQLAHMRLLLVVGAVVSYSMALHVRKI